MFSTPQSKAYFNQQIVKYKIIHQEINIYQYIESNLRSIIASCMDLIQFLLSKERSSEQIFTKLNNLQGYLDRMLYSVVSSNEMFNLEVSLRYEIKKIEHSFFTTVMRDYQNKIKELKHQLLVIENQVQENQSKGMLPYVENPNTNTVITMKPKNYYEYMRKLEICEKLQKLSISESAQKLMKMLWNYNQSESCDEKCRELEIFPKSDIFLKQQKQEKQEKKEKSQKQYKQEKSQKCQNQTAQKKIVKFCSQRVVHQPSINISIQPTPTIDINKILRTLLCLEQTKNIKYSKESKKLKFKIDNMNHCNKKLKEGIRNNRKIMQYECKEAMVRNGNIDFTLEESIEFLQEMSEDLRMRLNNRNIYLIVSADGRTSRTKSLSSILPEHVEWLKKEAECSQKQVPCLKDIGNNLTDSFLDQCSYLISDRFIDEDEETDLII